MPKSFDLWPIISRPKPQRPCGVEGLRFTTPNMTGARMQRNDLLQNGEADTSPVPAAPLAQLDRASDYGSEG